MLVPRIVPRKCFTLICDMQERFRPLIFKFPTILNRTHLLLESSRILDIPVIFAEQNPSRLGGTVPELSFDPAKDMKIEKMCFSMCTPALVDRLKLHHDSTSETLSIFLCGIEAHVCMYQTALDLLDLSKKIPIELYIACDAVSSQRQYERQVALDDLGTRGATMTTVESILFKLMGSADTQVCPQFKNISGLLKQQNESMPEWFA